MLISLAEYAQKHSLNHSVIRKRAASGGFATAQKIGRNWVIDSDEPYIDHRIKHGHYVGWRVPKTPNEQ